MSDDGSGGGSGGPSGSRRSGGGPAFTVIVPVHDVAPYLAACLDSVLEQDFDAVEVWAVDDASTDGGRELLEERAARDPRLHVLHTPRPVGPGPARNLALARATAPYLLFLDGDDTLAPGALAAIADRIERAVHMASEPDVVMFGFARSHPDGRVEPDPRSAALAPEATVTGLDRPALLEILPSAWNKAYRAGFVAEQALTFPDGWYEDLPWTYRVLMSAATIATLDRVCYLYRQRAAGNILSSAGRRHLDLFAQYDRAFAYLSDRPGLDAWRRPLFDRMSRHLPTVLETERIPADVRREFFHAAAAAFRRHRPPGYRPPGSAAVKVRLIERDDYRAFRAAQLVNHAARRVRARRGGRR